MKKALVVGINNYPASPLHGCINDACALARLIEKNGDGTPNFEVRMENDVRSKSNLKSLIAELFDGDSEIALLYFSGHGCLDTTGGYLVTPDARQHDTGVSMNEILTLANRSAATNKVIILDCCHSGTIGSASDEGATYTQLKEGVTILTSCRSKEVSMEVMGHGLFTSLLLEALEGCAADVLGHITPGSIYAYIDKALGAWQQRPVFKTNISRFTLLRSIEPRVPRKVLCSLAHYFSLPHLDFALDPSYEPTNSTRVKHEIVRPYARRTHVKAFKELQLMESAGLVTPVDTPHMYFAAMHSKSCRLTALGHHYWRLAKDGKL